MNKIFSEQYKAYAVYSANVTKFLDKGACL